MKPWQRKQYPPDWEALARACKERAGWRCEHCGVAQFTVIESRTGQPYTVYLHAAHADRDEPKSHPAPRLLALCIRCHARYDYALKERAMRLALEQKKHRRLLEQQGHRTRFPRSDGRSRLS